MKQTFKQFLKEVRYYQHKEDWQEDINQWGSNYGVCPRCGGEAHNTTEGDTLATAKSFLECQECGHKGLENRY